ncbi:MAG: hypothetical protein IPL32_03610 [Chloracidobacterium sp.]|nr:hypothetical protein [Chloracidobacterium sp.]
MSRTNVPTHINVGLAVGGAAADVKVDYLPARTKHRPKRRYAPRGYNTLPQRVALADCRASSRRPPALGHNNGLMHVLVQVTITNV